MSMTNREKFGGIGTRAPQTLVDPLHYRACCRDACYTTDCLRHMLRSIDNNFFQFTFLSLDPHKVRQRLCAVVLDLQKNFQREM